MVATNKNNSMNWKRSKERKKCHKNQTKLISWEKQKVTQYQWYRMANLRPKTNIEK